MRKCLWKCVVFCGTAFLFTIALTSYSAQGAAVLVGPNPMVNTTSVEYVMHGPVIPPCDPDCAVAVKHGPVIPLCDPDCGVAVKHGPVIPPCDPDCAVAVQYGPAALPWNNYVVEIKHVPQIQPCESCVVESTP